MAKLTKLTRKQYVALAISSVLTLVVAGVKKMDFAGSWLIALAIVTFVTIIIVFFLEGDRTPKVLVLAEQGDLDAVRRQLDTKHAAKVINEMGTNGNRLLHYAAAKRREPALMEKLIDLGADVNVQNLWKETPLHLAAEANHVAAIKVLLHHGADVSARDVHGKTPLDVVKKKNKKRTLAVIDAYLNH